MLRTSIDRGVVTTVLLAGEMDLDCADALRAVVNDARKGSEMVVLDFSDVAFIDSSGTGIFVRLCLDLQSEGAQLRTRSLSPAVKGVFDMLRVRDLVGDDVFLD